MYNAIQNSSTWNDHQTAAASLYSTLDDISGVNPSNPGFHASFDHYYDNLSARQCHAKPLPCKIVNGVNSTTCVTQDAANMVYRMGNWEYSYIYRDDPNSLNAAVGSYGVWIAELALNIRNVINGKSEIVYRHNIAHDGSLSRLLSFLQIDVMVWPGMGSEVVFEVYRKSDTVAKPRNPTSASTPAYRTAISPSGYYMRVLFGGRVFKSSSPTLGILDMVPLETVLAYFDGLVGVDASLIKGKCDGSVAY